MDADLVLMFRVFVITLLIGVSFAIFVKIFVSFELDRRRRLHDAAETEHAAAAEGNLRIHREVTK